MPQIVHFGARTGFVQELQMSHRQTWLIRRLMLACLGQPLESRLAPVSGRHVVVCGGGVPFELRSTNDLHRGCARGVGQRAPVCRCAATRRSKREIDHRWRPFRGRRVRETLHMTPGPDPASAVRY